MALLAQVGQVEEVVVAYGQMRQLMMDTATFTQGVALEAVIATPIIHVPDATEEVVAVALYERIRPCLSLQTS